MKRLFAAILLIALAVPCIFAQEEKPKLDVDPDIKLMGLYDTVGREWTHRDIHWSRGESPLVMTIHSKVESTGEAQAKVTLTNSDEWSGEFVSTTTVELKKITSDMKGLADKNLPKETLDMGFRKFECRKHYREKDGSQITTWTSTEFHPLIVKQTVFSGSDYAIKKLTSFNNGEVDPWLLYRKDGRSWTYEMAGGMTMKSTIKNVTSDGCEMETEMFKGDGTSMMAPTVTKIEFSTPGVGTGPFIKPMVPDEKEVECKAGKFASVSYDDGNTWMLKQYPGVIVKSEGLELVAFDLGHDMHEFYRTVGNSYTLKSTTKVAGFTIKQSMKYEVTKVDGRNVTYTMKSIDENGNVNGTSELSHTLPEVKEGEEPAALSAYSGQVEELVYTPGGTFPGIRTESGDLTMWTWNGITIRMEHKTDDVEMTQELTELNIQ